MARDYGEDLGRRLEDLHGRIHRGTYRAQPSRRRYIAKPDGRQRPLGVAALEDKAVLGLDRRIVQRALVDVLNALLTRRTSSDSRTASGPERGEDDALDALGVGINSAKVN